MTTPKATTNSVLSDMLDAWMQTKPTPKDNTKANVNWLPYIDSVMLASLLGETESAAEQIMLSLNRSGYKPKALRVRGVLIARPIEVSYALTRMYGTGSNRMDKLVDVPFVLDSLTSEGVGCVYVVESGLHGEFKIGFSADPIRRALSVQGSKEFSHGRVFISIPHRGARRTERQVLQKFYGASKHGEFFNATKSASFDAAVACCEALERKLCNTLNGETVCGETVVVKHKDVCGWTPMLGII